MTDPLRCLGLHCFETTLFLRGRATAQAEANNAAGTHFLVGSGIIFGFSLRGRGGVAGRRVVGEGIKASEGEVSHRSVLISLNKFPLLLELDAFGFEVEDAFAA
jgi:hypothetical protein